MRDAALLRGGDRIGDRGADPEHALERQAASGDEIAPASYPPPAPSSGTARRPALACRRALLDRVDRDDVRVVERSDGLGLALEALPALRVRCHARREDLQRDLAVQARVLGLEDLAHAADADLAEHAVVIEGGATMGGFYRWTFDNCTFDECTSSRRRDNASRCPRSMPSGYYLALVLSSPALGGAVLVPDSPVRRLLAAGGPGLGRCSATTWRRIWCGRSWWWRS